MEDNICTHLQNARALVGDDTLIARILDALIADHCTPVVAAGPGPGPTTPPPEPPGG